MALITSLVVGIANCGTSQDDDSAVTGVPRNDDDDDGDGFPGEQDDGEDAGDDDDDDEPILGILSPANEHVYFTNPVLLSTDYNYARVVPYLDGKRVAGDARTQWMDIADGEHAFELFDRQSGALVDSSTFLVDTAAVVAHPSVTVDASDGSAISFRRSRARDCRQKLS
ncbi:MAG: hypothetical protein M5R36_13240 [Deltaproteobacteria bacterium]|nr:hypothetical protein [Deltaproteobacteria bacterium]